MTSTYSFHSHVQVISRGKNKSAVAAAAYRAAELIKNEYDGRVHDYTRKGGVVHAEILLPAHAPDEYADRATLWNAVEKVEKAENSQLARELDIALPAEFTLAQNVALAREYVQKTFVDAGMCADLCLHDTGKGNPHMHVMLTMRPINEDGTWGGKQKKEYALDRDGNKIYDKKKRQYKCKSIPSTDWNDRGKADEWRKAWEDMANAELKRLGSDAQIDRRSYAEQGVDKIPGIHMGAKASQMERKGIATDRGNINRAIDVTNKQVSQLRARIKKVKVWIYSQPIENAPSMVDTMQGVAGGKQLLTTWEKVRNLQTKARALFFLQRNNIRDFEQFAVKLEQMFEQTYAVSNEIKAVDRRMDTLANHLTQYENYKMHRAVFKKYQQLSGKKAEAYYDKHFEEIQAYQDADEYLKAVLNGRTEVPINKWKKEQETLIGKRFDLCEAYYKLKDDVKDAEVLRRSAERLMREAEQERQPRQWAHYVDR